MITFKKYLHENEDVEFEIELALMDKFGFSNAVAQEATKFLTGKIDVFEIDISNPGSEVWSTLVDEILVSSVPSINEMDFHRMNQRTKEDFVRAQVARMLYKDYGIDL